MDTREQRVRDRIAALDSEIAELSARIDAKRTELQRYQSALDVWLSVDVGPAISRPIAPANPHTRFAGRRFLDCVREILADGPQTTASIHDALVAGGFESEATNFRSIVSNMLNEAAKNHRLTKIGERYSATWSLPENRSATLAAFVPRD